MRAEHTVLVPAEVQATIHLATGPESPLWVGSVKDIQTHRWPEVGGTMSWTMGRSYRFVATVTENALPDRLVLRVENPSGSGTVEHRFAPAAGGTRYTKVVTLPSEGFWHRIAWLWLPGAVKREVRRVRDAAART